MRYPGMMGIPCSLMRGGSSKGGFFLESDLPSDPCERAATLLSCYGSPDARQVDGLGGADPLTSKAAVVGRSSRPDADLDYTFYQVGIDAARISTGGTCGNMLAAVAPFALLSGLIKAGAGDYEARVRIHATNTGQLIAARFRVRDGYPLVDGESRIAGVPGSGSPILLDFGDCAGSVSGKLLPTGKPRDVIEFEGRALTVSLVDAATPFVFVRASDVGATGRETPAQLAGTDLTMRLLEYARGWAAKVLGFVADHRDAATVTPNVPRVIMVSPAQEYLAVNGRSVAAREIDVCVRQLAMQKPHKALAVTGSVCTAVAARIDGTVVSELTTSRDDVLRLGHASGITGVGCSVVALPEGQYRVERAEIERTARLIMQGWLWARDSHYHELLELLRSQRPSGVVPPGQADELTRLQDAA